VQDLTKKRVITCLDQRTRPGPADRGGGWLFDHGLVFRSPGDHV